MFVEASMKEVSPPTTEAVQRHFPMGPIEEYDHRVDTRQLEYFLAVADELNFTRAAGRVFAAQSTVSAGIRALERELGAALFTRNSHGVQRTPFADEILDHAKTILAATSRMAELATAETEIAGVLRVCLFAPFADFSTSQLIGEFVQAHPQVRIRERTPEAGPAGVIEALRQGKLDVATLAGQEAPAGLTAQPLIRSEFAAVLPATHPLAIRKRVSLRELAGQRWVDLDRVFATRAVLDKAFHERGLRRHKGNETTHLPGIPALVAATSSVAALPAITIPDTPGVVVVPLEETIPWSLSILMASEPTAAALAFFELFLKHFPPENWMLADLHDADTREKGQFAEIVSFP